MAEPRIEWLNDMADIESLRYKWRKLEETVNYRTVFASCDYVIPWYRYYRGNKHQQYGVPLLGTAWTDDKLTGVAPMTYWKGWLGGVPVHRIDFAGFNSHVGEFLVPDDKPEIIGRFIDSLIVKGGFDVICLNGFDTNSQKYQELGNAVSAHGLRMERSDYSYAIIDLKNGYNAYYDSLTSKRRNNIRRHAKNVAKAGTWQVDTIKSVENEKELTSFLERMIKIYNSSWKVNARGQLAEHHSGFFKETANRFVRREILHLSILSINSQDIAFFFALMEGGILYDLFISYAESFKELRPGEFMMQEIAKHLPDMGIRTIVSHGDHDYKKNWASDFVPLTRVFIFSNGLRSKISRLMKFKIQTFIEIMKSKRSNK